MRNGKQIDTSMLAKLERQKSADKAAHRKAADDALELADQSRQLAREHRRLSRTPTASATEHGQRFKRMEEITASIQSLKQKIADAEAARDIAKEKASASRQLWENCARFAGVLA